MRATSGNRPGYTQAARATGPDHAVQEMDRQIFDLVNQVRQRPQDMIPHLQQMEQRFDGMMYKQQGKTTVRTKEGVDAVRQAIQFSVTAELSAHSLGTPSSPFAPVTTARTPV